MKATRDHRWYEQPDPDHGPDDSHCAHRDASDKEKRTSESSGYQEPTSVTPRSFAPITGMMRTDVEAEGARSSSDIDGFIIRV